MHEQSETIQGRDGRWYNINGVSGEVLAPLFSFEAQHYDTMETAKAAAERRSDMFAQGQPSVPGESPPPSRPLLRIETLAEDILREYGLGPGNLPPRPGNPFRGPARPGLPGTLPLHLDKLLQGLQGPMSPMVAARREPVTLSDAIPLFQQAQFPGAFETVTPREADTELENRRLMNLEIPNTYRPGLLPPTAFYGGALSQARGGRP